MNLYLSFFDLDHTLLHVNCSFHFGLYLYRKKIIVTGALCQLLWYYFLHKCGRIDIYGIHQKSFDSLFRGKSDEEFRELGKSFVEQSFDGLINKQVLNILIEKQRRGERVVILSSSPDFLVEPFAKKMGVVDVFSSSYQTNKLGKYHSLKTILEGHEKSKLVKQIITREKIPHQNTFAYSDSHLDLPFLESVAIPIAVNPSKVLLKVCLQRGWKVL